MNTMQARIALGQLRRSLGESADEQTDRDLLSRFAAGDEHAFALLVRRHGPMVLGVCRGVLDNRADAEDAFQAAFLALARQAGRPFAPSCVGAWLHTVARRIAIKLRGSASRRRMHERQAGEREQTGDSCRVELRDALDEEVGRLPARCREAILRCYFHGQTREQAALQLGWSLRTLERRLEQGRQILRERLTARGTTLAVLLAVAPAGVPSALADLTVRGALGEVPPRVAELVGTALSGFSVLRGKIVFTCLLLLGLAAGSVLALLPRGNPPVRMATAPPAQRSAAPPLHEEPLPEGALARLGTTRFRAGFIRDIAYSRDGKLLVSAGNGRSLCIWDAATGRLLQHCKGQHYPNACAPAVAPDGRTVADAEGNFIKLWSVETGKELREYAGHTGLVWSIAFSPDGKVLASAGEDNTIRLWDAGTGREMRVLKGHTDHVWTIAFRDDGKVFASASSDGTVRLWDPRTGTVQHVCTGHRKHVLALAFEPGGKRIASFALAGGVRLWHSDTGKQECILASEDTSAFSLAFAPDGRTIAVARTDAIVLHDTTSGKELRRWRAGVSWIHSLAWSPNGKTLASGGWSTIHLWDPRTGKEQKSAEEGHVSPIDYLMFHNDGRRLYSRSWDGRSLEWDLATSKNRLFASDWPASFRDLVLAVSSDRKTLALISRPAGKPPAEPEIDLYDTTTNKKLHTLSGHTEVVMTADFDADGRRLFSLAKDRTVRAWDVGKGTSLWQAKVGVGGRGPHVRSLAVSPDGKSVACAIDTVLFVLDAATGKQLQRHPYGQHVFSLAWSPDGTRIVLVGGLPFSPGGVYLGVWDVRTGERTKYWQSPQVGFGNQIGIAFSPDSLFLATGHNIQGGSVYVWELATGGKVALFEGHHSGVRALAFSPDGRTLASGGGDSSILLWDVTRRMRDGKLPPAALSPARFAQLWDKLADTDAAVGHAAIWELVAAGRAALPMLQAKLSTASILEARQAAKLVERLDADDFATRQSAMKEADKLGLGAEPALRKALGEKPGLELRRRFDALLAGWLRSSDWLRFGRAIAVLEYNGGAEAKEILASLARGAEGARPTKEAAAALARIAPPATPAGLPGR